MLLAAIHYKGIEDGPDFDFVLSQGTTREWRAFETKNDPETEDDKRKFQWNVLLTEIGIHSSDDFELLVVEFLQSGLFDVSKVAEIIDRYVAEADVMNAQDEYRKFVDRSLWEHTLSEAELLAEASTLVEWVQLLDAYTVTALHEVILELQGGQAVADRALGNWIRAFRARNLQEVDTNNFFRRKLHPSIEAEFNAVNAKAQANTNVFDACMYMAQQSGWNAREELAMKSATVQNMEAIIRTRPASDLRLFMLKMMDFYINKGAYVTHFGAAMDNFVQACRNIVQAKHSGRLGRLIRILFDESKLGHLLDAQ